MQVLAIRHVAFEDLGSFATVLAARGGTITYHEAANGFAGVDPLAADVMVVLGGPIGAYEGADYPFLAAEQRLIERRIAAGRPLIGICLGAQLLAQALGARVYPGERKEIGWGELALSEGGRLSPLACLAEGPTPVLHWHGDTFDLPEGSVRLASTAAYENQAFAVGDVLLGLQFHAEVTATGLEHWFVGHAAEIAGTPGLRLADLRADTRRYGAALEQAGRTMFADWLDRNGLCGSAPGR
ncbi:MAG: glutamine amidotransferase [Rhodospirillales bacterium]